MTKLIPCDDAKHLKMPFQPVRLNMQPALQDGVSAVYGTNQTQVNSNFETSKDVVWLKELYFSDPSQHLIVKKDETLLQEGRYNDRLYLILDGTLIGYLRDENNENSEVFRSYSNMFVGVYSFFSPERISYLTITADCDTKVAYIQLSDNRELPDKLASHFLPVIVHEIYLRQSLAQKLTLQRQAAIRKLYEREKMAMLGQLAAGVAHELNNAVGVLDKNTDWLVEKLPGYFSDNNLVQLFKKTFAEGQSSTTAELRSRRDALEKRFGIPRALAKQLGRTTLTETEIEGLLSGSSDEIDVALNACEAGIVLHDMKIAATHASHVVQSVRELGNAKPGNSAETTVYETVRKAVSLTRSLMQNVTLVIEKSDDCVISANPGDLVQVWVNLIKNACESMISSGIPEPVLTIRISASPERKYSVCILDNGPGINNDILPRIFQPNFTTKVTGLSFGLGVGLSVVKKIISDYKGSITVSSSPGETCFTVLLPKP